MLLIKNSDNINREKHVNLCKGTLLYLYANTIIGTHSIRIKTAY